AVAVAWVSHVHDCRALVSHVLKRCPSRAITASAGSPRSEPCVEMALKVSRVHSRASTTHRPIVAPDSPVERRRRVQYFAATVPNDHRLGARSQRTRAGLWRRPPATNQPWWHYG